MSAFYKLKRKAHNYGTSWNKAGTTPILTSVYCYERMHSGNSNHYLFIIYHTKCFNYAIKEE